MYMRALNFKYIVVNIHVLLFSRHEHVCYIVGSDYTNCANSNCGLKISFDDVTVSNSEAGCKLNYLRIRDGE